MTKITVHSSKEKMVVVESRFFTEWSPRLEEAARGASLVYLQLNVREGDFSLSDLGKMVGVSSRTTVLKILGALEEEGLISKIVEPGSESSYTITPLPGSVRGEDSNEVNEVTREPVDVLVRKKKALKPQREEIFSDSPVSEMLRKTYEDQVEDLEMKTSGHANDMVRYFFAVYYLKNTEKYKEKVTGRERKNLKDLIEEFGWVRARRAVRYAIENWDNLDYVDGYPSIAAVYGFRTTIVPESTLGKVKKGGRLQHDPSDVKRKSLKEESWFEG